MSDVTVKTATLAEYGEVVKFAQQEGWNFRLEDLAIWMKCDRPEAFMVAIKNGQVVGGIMSLLKSNGFGYVSFFVVKKEERGSGVGQLLFKEAMKTQYDVNSVLISAPLMTNKYRDAFGFHIIPNLSVIDAKGNPTVPDSYSSQGQLKLVHVDEFDLQLIINYDQSIVPYERSIWLTNWLRHPTGSSVVCVDQMGNVVGYGVIRTGYHIVQLGPIYADSTDVAQLIIARLISTKLAEINQFGLSLRYSSDNDQMRRIATELNLTPTGHANVQFTKVPAKYDATKIFAFSDFGLNYA